MCRMWRWLRRPTLMDQIIQAEIDGPQVRGEDPELEARILAMPPALSRLSEAEIQRVRSFRAWITAGTEDEDPEDIALMRDDEKERLERFSIRLRWARFLDRQR